MAKAPQNAVYKSAYSSKIDDLVNKAVNRQPFTYDPATDAAYQAYARQYTNLGNEAAQNTLADTAANTGGLASSFAVSAANQQRSAYNQALTDKIPALMQAAYEKYRGDYNDALAGISTLQGLDDSAYNRYASDRSYNRGVYESDRAFNEDVRRYGIEDAFRNRQFNRSVYESDRDYARSVFESDRGYDEAVRQFNKEFGLSEAQFNEAVRQYNQNFARSAYESDRDFAEQQRQFEKQFGLSEREFAEGVRQYDQNFGYQMSRDQVADDQWNRQFDYQMSRDKVADEQWNKEFEEKVREYDQNYNLDKNSQKFQEMLDTWTTLGYANKKVANYFGVKEGTKTNEASYQAAQLALDRKALAKSGRSGRSGGSGRYYRSGGSTYQSKEDKYGKYVEKPTNGIYKDSPYHQALHIATQKLQNGASKDQVMNYLNTVKGLSLEDKDRLKQALGLGGNKKDYHKQAKDPYSGTNKNLNK